MGFFNRDKTTQTTLPSEINDYYQAEIREKRGVAWLVTLLTLVITALLVVFLFLGGRWLYRKVRNEQTPVSSTVSVEQQTDQNKTESTDQVTDPSPEASTDQQSQVNAPDDELGETGSDATTPTPAQPESNQRPEETSADNTPQVTQSSQPQTLVNTGPGEFIPVFGIVAIVGYALSIRKLQDRKG